MPVTAKGPGSQLHISPSRHISLESFAREQFLRLSLAVGTLTLVKTGPAFSHSPVPPESCFFHILSKFTVVFCGMAGPKELLQMGLDCPIKMGRDCLLTTDPARKPCLSVWWAWQFSTATAPLRSLIAFQATFPHICITIIIIKIMPIKS